MWTLLFVGILPMIVFAVLESYLDAKKGVIGAIILAAISGVLTWVLMGEVDYEIFLVVGLMLVTGLISIKTNNSIYFKFQPVVNGVVYVLVFAWFQFFDVPIMAKYLPKMAEQFKESFPPQALEFLLSDNGTALLSRISLFSMVWLGIHAGLVGYCALRTSTKIWLVARTIGGPFVAFGAYLTEAVRQVLY